MFEPKKGHGIAVAPSQSGSFLLLCGRECQALSWWRGGTEWGWGSHSGVRGGVREGSGPMDLGRRTAEGGCPYMNCSGPSGAKARVVLGP
jgi:hypothetical protein